MARAKARQTGWNADAVARAEVAHYHACLSPVYNPSHTALHYERYAL